MVASSILPTLVSAVAAGPLACVPQKPTCAAPNGNFTVNEAGLYPENADFDPSRCVTYISNLYKNTVTAYNAAEDRVDKIITIDKISGVPAFHVSGVQRDVLHDKLTISANAGAAFDTNGADVSGDNVLVQYDLVRGEVEWTKNLTSVSNGQYGGFQDVEHDKDGNSYVIGTFPSSIVKVTADGKTATEWFRGDATNTTIHGFTGIAAYNGARNVLVADGERGQIVRFDLAADKGVPVHVPLQAVEEPIGANLDGAYLPPLYKDTVLLVSDSARGTIVLRSQDGKWESAEKLGEVANALGAEGGSSVTTVQIADRIYAVTDWFGDNSPEIGLNRTAFPFHDITDAINKLLV
ncbi:Major allergen Mal f 1 [Beauveria bassiana]|uniref:Major allergen Mal f 1 n=1 Tax=Beauveria bassiana TaxID=176275 RepID=A0A2N6NK24_BEABA|nr:Major allergen Mal f 1 [Beauveria bassiana]